MRQALRLLLSDCDLASAIVARARDAVLAGHTCRHRAEQLLRIVSTLDRAAQSTAPGEFEGVAS
jgi:hypothetical protein